MSIDKLLENHISKIPDKDIAVLLSGGIDSNSVALSAKRIGKNVHGYTFYLKDIQSYDYIKSKEICDYFGFKFTPIEVPRDNLKTDFFILRDLYNCVKKTNFECVFPLLYTMPKIKERFILTGLGADTLCGSSKRANIHGKLNKEKFDSIRIEDFNKFNPSSINQFNMLAKKYNKIVFNPFREMEIFDYFMKFTHDEINKPKNKFIIRKEYPELYHLNIKPHWNYQLCAGIDKLFETLLNDNEINFKNRKRMLDVYRDWSKNDRILIC